jgi:hypothetical protein
MSWDRGRPHLPVRFDVPARPATPPASHPARPIRAPARPAGPPAGGRQPIPGRLAPDTYHTAQSREAQETRGSRARPRPIPGPRPQKRNFTGGKPTRSAGPPAARAPEAARQQIHPRPPVLTAGSEGNGSKRAIRPRIGRDRVRAVEQQGGERDGSHRGDLAAEDDLGVLGRPRCMFEARSCSKQVRTRRGSSSTIVRVLTGGTLRTSLGCHCCRSGRNDNNGSPMRL